MVEKVDGIAQFYYLKSNEQKVFSMITHAPFRTTPDILHTREMVWDTFELLGGPLENPTKSLRDL